MINQTISQYNVLYNTPSLTDRGAMPIGNGETVLNLWCEKNSGLSFYFTRTDALTEFERNVKIGKVKLLFSSNPFLEGNNFSQVLNLTDGTIDITTDTVTMRVFVDSESQEIYIIGKNKDKCDVTADLTNWRKTPQSRGAKLTKKEDYSVESADILEYNNDNILVYHQNGKTDIEWVAELEELTNYISDVPDILSKRIFGACMSLTNSNTVDNTLVSKDCSDFILKITTKSIQTDSLDSFKNDLINEHKNTTDADVALDRTTKWWNAYWEKSYVFIEGDVPVKPTCTDEIEKLEHEIFNDNYNPPSTVTAAYILSKFMSETNALGNEPIRFNGYNFLTMPHGNRGIIFDEFAKSLSGLPLSEPTAITNPDLRPWDDATLWQNIRLPYYSMLMRGEFTEIKVLFNFYLRMKDMNRNIAKVFYGASGQYNTEMHSSYAMINPFVYGLDRKNYKLGYSDNRYGGAIDISPGLELLNLMLEYYYYTKDEKFLVDEILVYAYDIILYIETRFSKRVNGLLHISPIQCVETYFDTTNCTPILAGIHCVLNKLLNLPDELCSVNQKDYFSSILKITPTIPTTKNNDDKTIISPAYEYDNHRYNVEIPEFYTVYPFDLYSQFSKDTNLILDTYQTLIHKESNKKLDNFRPRIIGEYPGIASYSGWQYLPMVAAILGLSNDVKEMLENNCSLKNPHHRFPAAFGPAYDSVPDVDHASNILSTVQLMLMQYDKDGEIKLGSALPCGWNAKFRLFGKDNTIVECEILDGKIVKKEILL